MEELKVGTAIISKQGEDSENYKKFKRIVNEKKIKTNVVGAITNRPQKIQIEKDLYFEILWPNNEKLIQENILNNNSIVAKLFYNDFSMLFTGDIEEIAEKQILQLYKNTHLSINTNNGINASKNELLNSTILKVGHHGSKTSTTQEFVEAVKPKIALIGVGENNKFGHPNSNVIERLKALRLKNL